MSFTGDASAGVGHPTVIYSLYSDRFGISVIVSIGCEKVLDEG